MFQFCKNVWTNYVCSGVFLSALALSMANPYTNSLLCMAVANVTQQYFLTALDVRHRSIFEVYYDLTVLCAKACCDMWTMESVCIFILVNIALTANVAHRGVGGCICAATAPR